MIQINIIKSYRDVVAACDSSILGKKFEESFNDVVRQLDIKESFYKGEEVSAEKAVEMMKHMTAEDATFNIAGKEAVAAAIRAGVISEESLGEIQGIPFAL